MIFKLNHEELKENPFVLNGKAAFYHYLFETLTGKDYDTDCQSMDCRRINIAKNIQDSWYDSATEQGIDHTSLTMNLALCGPKVNQELLDDEVEIEQNAIQFTDNTYFEPETWTGISDDNQVSPILIRPTEHETNTMKAIGNTNWYLTPRTKTESKSMIAIPQERMMELMNAVAEHMCVAERCKDVIIELIGIGFTKEELKLFHFCDSDIEDAYKDIETANNGGWD